MSVEAPKSPEGYPLEGKFNSIVDQNQVRLNSLLCVGLDLDTLNSAFPEQFKPKNGDVSQRLSDMGITIVDNTYDVASLFKPNIAFFEMHGDAGRAALKNILAEIRKRSPSTPIILDYKRTDIGNTNIPYVVSAFDDYGVDAVTVNPYFGGEALQPFLDRKDKGIIVLCRTSNPGAKDFQYSKIYLKDMSTEEAQFFHGIKETIEGVAETGDTSEAFIRTYQHVAYRAAKEWNKNKNISIVVGATAPDELTKARKIVGDQMKILTPGLGKSQGGRVEDLPNAFDSRERGAIANLSRQVDFAIANPGETYAQAVRREAITWRDAINVYRK